jgi:hypothetical protein
VLVQIRAEQIGALQKDIQERFQSQVAAYLRRHLPAMTGGMGETDLRARIKRWQEQAASYGIVTQRAVTKWCFLSMVLGDNFQQIPSIQQYLRQDIPDGSTKVHSLMKALEVKLREKELGREGNRERR